MIDHDPIRQHAEARMIGAKAQFSRAAEAVLNHEALADDLVWLALAELEEARKELRSLAP